VTSNILEIACFNFESAKIAEQCGADRIELCENYSAGGITPSVELIRKVKSEVLIPVHVMIRPRGGNFIYSNTEFNAMKNSVLQCKSAGIDGVVFGILTHDNRIDKNRCRELVTLAQPMSTTFHRAFDEVPDSTAALEEIIECCFSRILTSGKSNIATGGAELISELNLKAGDRIIIMPGGGVRAENILELKRKIGANEFHSSAIAAAAVLADENEIRKMKSNLLRKTPLVL
jgi:copper homeostasis protein